jgi:hypothetical protein
MNPTALTCFQFMGYAGIDLALLLIDAFACTVIALMVILYRRDGATYRPHASRMAYLLAITAAAVPVFTFFGDQTPPTLPSVVLHCLLALATIATRGNVVELFHTSGADNLIYRWLRKDRRKNERQILAEER